jgi:hypothetical protein
MEDHGDGTNTNEKKSSWWKWLIVIAILGVAVWFILKSCNAPQEQTVTKKYADSLQAQLSKANWEKGMIGTDNYKQGLREGAAIYADSLLAAKMALSDCQGKKVAYSKPSKTRVNNTTKKKETQTIIPPSFVPQKNNTQTAKPTNNYNTSVQTTNFVGMSDGDFWITVSPDGYLEYGFSKKLYDDAGGTATPELFYPGSKKLFNLEGNNYIYVDKNVKVGEGMLKATKMWCIYIGNGKGYPAYLPHEAIKPEILQARGRLDGNITSEDVKSIAKIVPEVAAGRIIPNKILDVDKSQYSDGNYYEGWAFCNTILYKTK